MEREMKIKKVQSYLTNLGFSMVFCQVEKFPDSVLDHYYKISKNGKTDTIQETNHGHSR